MRWLDSKVPGIRDRNYQRFGMIDAQFQLLSVSLDDEIVHELKSYTKARVNVKDLDKLRRLRTKISKIDQHMMERLGSFSYSYGLITSILIELKQINILHTIRGIFALILKTMTNYNIENERTDDFIRQKLKSLNSWALKYVSTNPGYMFLMHLHSLGGKSPYTDSQIEEDITSWISKVSGKIDDNKDYINRKLDHYFAMWPRKSKSHPTLSFYEYCMDIQRWATSGGAQRTEYNGEYYRTKWMWGYVHGRFDQLHDINKNTLERHGEALYQRAIASGNVCNVALKEEASKTREVITTPMASYLRQSYLLYRWGKPRHLQSPIASSAWLRNFNATLYKWYGAIDGDRFDHTVPKWFIIEVINRLGQLNDECRWIADAEIESMLTLKIRWKKKEYLWEGGLLSGWRITSIIGTLLSLIAGNYITEELGVPGSVNVAAMGDDLILYSHTQSLDKHSITELYNQFGLTANVHKTNVGRVGDFLRRLYAPRGVYCYPWLGLKSLLYANPWVDKYTYDLETELANNWWTAFSRTVQWSVDSLAYTKWFISVYKMEVAAWFPKLCCLDDLINTPISAGGLGVNQSVTSLKWRELSHPMLRRTTDFLALYGIIKLKEYKQKTAVVRPLNPRKVLNITDRLRYEQIKSIISFTIGDDIAIFPTLWWWYNKNKNSTWLSAHLGILIPYYLRNKPTELLQYIIGQLSGSASLTSVICPKENQVNATNIVTSILKSVSISKRHISSVELKAASTLLLMQLTRDDSVVNGTW